jgi:hypothetical protein
LSIQFLRLFSDTAYWVVLVAWLVSAAVILPQTEQLLASKVYRLREPHELELVRIGPAWFAICAAAGVHGRRNSSNRGVATTT